MSNTVVQALKEGAVRFTYVKADGTVRTANGTLNPALAPESQRAGIEQIDASSEKVSYWDMDAENFRQFNVSTAKIITE